jgi:hypothetical protein
LVARVRISWQSFSSSSIARDFSPVKRSKGHNPFALDVAQRAVELAGAPLQIVQRQRQGPQLQPQSHQQGVERLPGLVRQRGLQELCLLRGHDTGQILRHRAQTAPRQQPIDATLGAAQRLAGRDAEQWRLQAETGLLPQNLAQEADRRLAIAALEMVDLVEHEGEPGDMIADRGQEIDLRLRDRRVRGDHEQGGIALGQEIEGCPGVVLQARADAWRVDQHDASAQEGSRVEQLNALDPEPIARVALLGSDSA